MSFRVSSSFRLCLAVAALAYGGLRPSVLLAQGQPSPEKPETPASTTAPPRPTVNRPSAYHNGLLRLEDQLSRSFQFLKPNSAMDGLPTPPLPQRAAPPVLNQKARDLLDQRKNWAFVNPDDLTAMPKPEDMLNLPEHGSDGLDKKRATTIERFYQDLERRKSSLARPDRLTPEDPRQSKSRFGTTQDSDSADDPNLPGGVQNSEKKLRKLLQGQDSASAPDPTRRNFLDIFGLGEQKTTPEEELAQKAYLKDFREWLNRAPAVPANNPANPMAAADPMRQALPATGGFNPLAPGTRPDNYDPSLGAVNPTMVVSTPPDVTAKALNQWNPLYTPPKVEPAKTPPPAPIFDVPRRKF